MSGMEAQSCFRSGGTRARSTAGWQLLCRLHSVYTLARNGLTGQSARTFGVRLQCGLHNLIDTRCPRLAEKRTKACLGGSHPIDRETYRKVGKKVLRSTRKTGFESIRLFHRSTQGNLPITRPFRRSSQIISGLLTLRPIES
jgi:hypothetical protein